ncbi:hypothetical protein B0H14DRAFT_2652978 [Mycena olivaceomarginata]|nr:hypothetical protein B0H14DRAFT_2652978 [Mycena olivaceomarginata]
MSQFIQRKFALSSRQSRSRSYGRMARNIGHGTYVHVPPSPAPSRFTTFGIPACASHPAADTGFGGAYDDARSSRSMRCGDRKLKKLLPRKDYVVRMPAAAETLDFDIALVTRLNALAEFGFDTTIAWCKALLMQMPTSSRAPRFWMREDAERAVCELVSAPRLLKLGLTPTCTLYSAHCSFNPGVRTACVARVRTRTLCRHPSPPTLRARHGPERKRGHERERERRRRQHHALNARWFFMGISASAVLGSFPLFSGGGGGGGGGDLQGLGAARVKGD